MKFIEDKCRESNLFSWVLAIAGCGLMIWIYFM